MYESKVYHKFRLTCEDGGYGDWGKTNSVAEMCAPGNTVEEATSFVKSHTPGGWRMEYEGIALDSFYPYLKHLNPPGSNIQVLEDED